jgi:hypothetical protein
MNYRANTFKKLNASDITDAVAFEKRECDTAICILDNEKIRINQRHIYACIGHLEKGEKLFVDSRRIYK